MLCIILPCNWFAIVYDSVKIGELNKYMSEIIYIDMEQSNFHNSVNAMFIPNKNIVFTGKNYLPIPACYKKEKLYQILANEFDIRFIFDDYIPIFNFYPIPSLEIFAIDSTGGCIGSIKKPVSFDEDDSPIYYISSNKPNFIAPNLKEFMQLIVFCTDWRNHINYSFNKPMNISKTTKDYMIDTLKLKEYVCNEVDYIDKSQDLRLFESFDEAKKCIDFYDISIMKNYDN